MNDNNEAVRKGNIKFDKALALVLCAMPAGLGLGFVLAGIAVLKFWSILLGLVFISFAIFSVMTLFKIAEKKHSKS